MKACATYQKTASKECQEIAKALKAFCEDQGYLFFINYYAQEDIYNESVRFIKEAETKLDAAMKGWTPVADGTETNFEILHLKELVFSYNRYYTK